MIIDLHCHYSLSAQRPIARERFGFEMPVANARGRLHPQVYDACLSPRALNRWSWRLARRVLGLPAPGPALDRQLAARYDRHLQPTGPVERFVLLAFDAAHDDEGRCPPLPGPGDHFGSDLYVSNSFVRHLCQRHPDRFLFGASVHPYRPDAPALVEELFAAGACLLKWIPLHQNIDIADPRTRDVLHVCAALGLPVLVHYGPEFTLTTHRPEYERLDRLLETLRHMRQKNLMPTTIVAHVATPTMPLATRVHHEQLLTALRGEFAHAPLYADLSALTAWGKVPYLRRLARRPELHRKLLFGSDFPVPPGMPRLRRDLGVAYGPLAAIESWPQRTAAIYRHLGFNEVVFHRAATLLPNLDHFEPVPTASA